MSKKSEGSISYERLNKSISRESSIGKEVEAMFRQDLIQLLNSYLDYQQADLSILFEQVEGKNTVQVNLVYHRSKEIKVL